MVGNHHSEGLAKDQGDPDKDIPEPGAEPCLDKLGDGEEGRLDQHPQEAPDLEPVLSQIIRTIRILN